MKINKLAFMDDREIKENVLNKIDKKWRVHFEILKETGIRVGELAQIAKIWDSKQPINHKGKIVYPLEFKPNKMNKNRVVFINERLGNEIFNFNVDDPKKITKYCNQTLSRKLGYRINPHQFRHRYQTNLMNLRFTDISIAAHMGYNDINSVRKYTHASKNQSLEIFDSINLASIDLYGFSQSETTKLCIDLMRENQSLKNKLNELCAERKENEKLSLLNQCKK